MFLSCCGELLEAKSGVVGISWTVYDLRVGDASKQGRMRARCFMGSWNG